MILESAKQYATAFAEQKVTDAVILCPVHFNQAERRALKRSAELAGIKVLQLMTNHAAGMFVKELELVCLIFSLVMKFLNYFPYNICMCDCVREVCVLWRGRCVQEEEVYQSYKFWLHFTSCCLVTVALNYGVFRRKEFNSTAQNYMFFDMGSTSTTVSIVSYQVSVGV